MLCDITSTCFVISVLKKISDKKDGKTDDMVAGSVQPVGH